MNIEKIKILSNKFQTVKKLQVPNILVTIASITCNVLDVSYIKHFEKSGNVIF